MLRKALVFREVTCFAAFLVLWQSLVSTGYAQQAQDSVPPAVSGFAKPSGGPTEKSDAVRPHILPGQPVDFRPVISVSPVLSSLTVAGVVNNTLTITYTVYNLRSDPVNGV